MSDVFASPAVLGLVAVGVLAFALVLCAWLIKRPQLTFAILLLLMPFHTGVFQVARVEFSIPPTVSLILQSWKELFIVLLAGWVIFRVIQTGRLRSAHPWLVLLVLAFIISGIPALYRSADLISGLYGFRGTFEPFIVLALLMLIPLDTAWIKKILPWIFVFGTLEALFAIYQERVLGFPYLWKYYVQNNTISTSFLFMGGSFQRAMGTFSSPNQLSLFMDFLIITLVNLYLRQPKRYRYAIPLIALFLVTLLLTVSRSGFVGLVVGLAVTFVLWRRKQRLLLVGIILLCLALVVGTGLGLDDYLTRTLGGGDISANYHVQMFTSNLQTILANPLGVGLGRVGARATRFNDLVASGGTYNTESYLLQTGMELGIPGLLLFILIVIGCLVVIYRNIFRLSDPWARGLAVTALAALAAAMAHSLLIPDLADLTISIYLWFFVAIGLRLPVFERQQVVEPKPALVDVPSRA